MKSFDTIIVQSFALSEKEKHELLKLSNQERLQMGMDLLEKDKPVRKERKPRQ